MIAMRPIKEPEVIDALNADRFQGDIEGYVVMDGATYLGHILYKTENKITEILDADLQNNMLVDGAVRACVANGQFNGAISFIITSKAECLIKWKDVFCKSDDAIPIEKLFGQCK